MRSQSLLSFLLAMLVCGQLHTQLRAQEFLPADQGFAPLEVPLDRANSLLNAPDPSLHAGLLGKIYMQERYVQQSIEDANLRQIDKSIQGFDTLINLPAITLDLPTPLDFDVFFGYSNTGIKGNAMVPPLGLSVGVNGKNESYAFGTSIYPTLSERWRPFVQVGAQYDRSDIDFMIQSPLGGFAQNEVDHSTRLLLNFGFEYDLLDYLGYRMAFHTETKDRLRDSVVTNDLILWPHERVFIRGGIVTPTGQRRLGFMIGGGVAF